MNAPEPPPVIPGPIKPLLQRLGDRDPDVRRQALWEADRLSPGHLADELRDFVGLADPTESRWLWTGCMSLLALPVGYLLIAGLAKVSFDFWSFNLVGLLMAGIVTVAPFLLARTNVLARRRAHRVIEALTRCSNRGAAGALLIATEIRPAKPPLLVLEALERLLVQFQPGDHVLLDYRERDRLFNLLYSWSGMRTDGQIAALHALSIHASTEVRDRVRTKRSHVQLLSEYHPDKARLLAAVTAAESAIEANLAAQRNVEVLLRPAAAAASEETLLRPAGATGHDADVLLRPAEDDVPQSLEQTP